jgi:hypothetical protein
MQSIVHSEQISISQPCMGTVRHFLNPCKPVHGDRWVCIWRISSTQKAQLKQASSTLMLIVRAEVVKKYQCPRFAKLIIFFDELSYITDQERACTLCKALQMPPINFQYLVYNIQACVLAVDANALY